MTLDKAIEILKDMNDGYTFESCRTCSGSYNEDKCCCDKNKCDELKAIDTVVNYIERRRKNNGKRNTYISD